jgi:hypothetical protein
MNMMFPLSRLSRPLALPDRVPVFHRLGGREHPLIKYDQTTDICHSGHYRPCSASIPYFDGDIIPAPTDSVHR